MEKQRALEERIQQRDRRREAARKHGDWFGAPLVVVMWEGGGRWDWWGCGDGSGVGGGGGGNGGDE